jgi:hypothetical protein
MGRSSRLQAAAWSLLPRMTRSFRFPIVRNCPNEFWPSSILSKNAVISSESRDSPLCRLHSILSPMRWCLILDDPDTGQSPADILTRAGVQFASISPPAEVIYHTVIASHYRLSPYLSFRGREYAFCGSQVPDGWYVTTGIIEKCAIGTERDGDYRGQKCGRANLQL